MRLIRMSGLVAVAALASMAFVGANSASADTFCKMNGLHFSECPVLSKYTGNITGLTGANAPAIILENGVPKEECHSKFLALGSTIVNEGAHIGAKILVDELSFSNCMGLCSKMEGTRPFWLLLQALTLDAFIFEDGVGKARVAMSSCTFGIECEYQFTNANQLLSIGTDTIIAVNLPLEKVGGSFLCPNNNMTLDATWLTTEDKDGGAPIYIASLP